MSRPFRQEYEVREETYVQEAHPQNFQRLPEEIVGMDALVQDVVGKLDNVKKLGFAGMGGLGKTTLAKAVFNHLGSRFEYTCFVPTMKLIAGTEHDAKAAVWEHMHHRGKKVNGRKNWSSLKGKTSLVVLDDICLRDEKVLHDLARDSVPESRFIATSRDQNLLSSLDDIFVVPFLESKTAKVLFKNCAFPKKTEPPKELESVMDEIIKKCDGVPLTLEVLGKYLKRKDNADQWKEALIALKDTEAISSLDERLWAKLRPGYNDLTEKEQQIFLDASTFFCRDATTWMDRPWTLREAKAAWRAAYNANAGLLWQTLVDRSLVYSVEEDEPIKVHEQLQSFGQKIATEPNNIAKCRIGDGDVGLQMLQSTTEDLNGMDFHALRLGGQEDAQENTRWIDVPEAALAKVQKLKFLEVNCNATIAGSKDCAYDTGDVVLLKCRGYDHVHNEIWKNLWGSMRRTQQCPECQNPFNPVLQTQLVVLYLTWLSKDPLPSSIGRLESLEHLTIRCSFLRMLPDSFGQLRSLQHLTFAYAIQLESLPQSFGQLRALQHLTISHANELESLPESFGQLRALQHLTIAHAYQLKRLPESFGELSALQHLRIGSAERLESLPESFAQLKAMQHLTIEGAHQLKSLPESFGQLKALQHLTITFAKHLESFPDSFGQLRALEHLTITFAYELKSLPESFTQLGALQHLTVSHSNQLESLPESFGHLRALQHLTIEDFLKLKSLPESFGQLSALQHLTIDGAQELKSLPESFGGLSSLNHLEFKWGGLLTLPESFGQLKALEHLRLVRENLEWLPESFGELNALRSLEIESRGKFHLPNTFGQLSNLHWLKISLLRGGQIQSKT